MFLSNLLLPMILLLPQASSVHEGNSRRPNGSTVAPLEPSLAHTIQNLLLARLGLQSQPNPRPGALVPQYLLDLYRFHSQQYHLIEDPEFSYPTDHVQGANTVRTFHHEAWSDLRKHGEKRDRIHMAFDLSSIPPFESVVSAELRFLRGGSGEANSELRTVSLYHSGDAEPELLHSRQLARGPKSGGSWVAFPLKAGLFRELSAGSGKLSFILEVNPDNGSRSAEDVAAEGHFRVRRSAGQNERAWKRQRPLLVTYSHDGRNAPLVPLGGAKKRGAKARKGGKKSQTVWEGVWTDRRVKRNGGGRAAKLKRLSRARCRRHPLYVDFKDVGWNKWIVAPTGYDAFFCLGECRFPLTDHMNSSSHAMVQTLLNSVNGSVPRACCVPTSLSPIALLYLDQDENVVLKNYQDMVVEGCGCR